MVFHVIFPLLDNVLPSTLLVISRENHVYIYDFLINDKVHDNCPNEMRPMHVHVEYSRCCPNKFAEPGATCNDQRNLPNRSISPFSSSVSQTRAICSVEKLTAGRIGGGGGMGNRPILYIGKRELRALLENRAAAAAACCCKNDDGILELLFAVGVVDEDGVGERERREIGDRERDLDEPDADDLEEEEEEDRLIGALILCCLGDDEDGTMSAFARSGRGMGRRDFNDNVLTILKEISFQRKN